MQWRDHQPLAASLRKQGLADCLAARFCLRDQTFRIEDATTNLAHVVVAKSQQCVEKTTKGLLLWQTASFDPTKGHRPFTTALDLSEKEQKYFRRFILTLNRLNPKVVSELKWLESLSPCPPHIPEERRGEQQPLDIIQENTEYPFWSGPRACLVIPADGLALREHASRAFKALRNFLVALAKSDPAEYALPIQQFLDFYRLPTDIVNWPEPGKV